MNEEERFGKSKFAVELGNEILRNIDELAGEKLI